MYLPQRFRWENKNFIYYNLTENDENFFDKYVIKIREKDLNRFKELVELLERKEFETLYGEFENIIKNVYIDVHLYQPLLRDHDQITIIPKGLNPGEVDFINYLKQYLRSVQDELERKDIFIYVLRNRNRGKGIGFFETYGFYPDFILWIKKKNIQHILFVEPHGLVHFSERDKEKIDLHRGIRKIGENLKNKTGKNVFLDSYILSVSGYEDIKHIFNLSKEELKKVNIFPFKDEKEKCIKEMLEPYI